MLVALHVAANNPAVENIETGEERGSAVALVIMSHCAIPAFLRRQAGLGAIEGLDLALLVDREHDSMGGRIDTEPTTSRIFLAELGIGGELELPHAMWQQPARPPDALHRTDADPALLCYHGIGPVCRFTGRIAKRQGDNAFGHLGAKWRNTRLPDLVTQQAVETLVHERYCQCQTQALDLPV
jgi:hypothetical protein